MLKIGALRVTERGKMGNALSLILHQKCFSCSRRGQYERLLSIADQLMSPTSSMLVSIFDSLIDDD